MIRLGLILAALVLLYLAVIGTARAASLPFVVASQAAGKRVANPSRFTAIIGYADQCVRGIDCWVYTKGSRAKKASYPTSWYLHVNGVRVRDKTFGLYVMDPRSRGWQQHVAKACPRLCFLDGLGPLSVGRTTPHLPWTGEQWVNAAAQVVRAVSRAGKLALPNSLGSTPATSQPLVAASGGRGSSEVFSTSTARTVLGQGNVWVSERGNCAAKHLAYQALRGRGDHFACYEFGRMPWDTGWMVA